MAGIVQLKDESGNPVYPVTGANLVDGLSKVAKTGNYNDLLNKPPATEVNEEDIDFNAQDKLQFADRVNGVNTNGKNYVILRRNKTFAEQVTVANTIYEIRDNFSLTGNFSLPANCSLFFNGGKISGAYNLVGSDTTILGNVFLYGVTLTGRYTNDFCELTWWGCVTTANVDNSNGLDLALKSNIRTIVVRGKYGLSKPVNIAAGAHVIIGGSVGGYLQDGFVANSDFAAISISVRGNTYTASGVLYHYYDQDAIIKNLNIDAAWVSKYGIEHIGGYSCVALDDVYIKNAKIAGILQYGCEKPIWKHVRVLTSNIGFYVSNKRINEENPLDNTGENAGSSNLVTLYDCRALSCNYGMILFSGSNTSLDNCETAYNALAGIVAGGRVFLKNFYSEGDAYANFYWDANGNKIQHTSGDGYVPQALVTANKDGFDFGNNTILYGGSVYFRAPIVSLAGFISIHDAFISIKPRSHATSNVTASDRVLPTDRTASGVDAIFILKNAKSLTVDGALSIYKHSSDAGTNVYPRHFVICGNTISKVLPSIDLKYAPIALERDPIFVAITPIIGSNNGYYTIGSRTRNANPQSLLSNYPTIDFSHLLDQSIYGTLASYGKINQKLFKLSDVYDGIPLYRRDATLSNFNVVYVAKTDLQQWFGNEEEIKFRVVVKIPTTMTTRLLFRVNFLNASYGLVASYANDASAESSFEPGIYDIVFVAPVNLLYDDTWDKIQISLQINNEASNEVYVSSYMMYNVSAPLTPPILLSNTPQSGTTGKRPTANVGQVYFDTSLNKMIVWNGTAWVNMDGTALS